MSRAAVCAPCKGTGWGSCGNKHCEACRGFGNVLLAESPAAPAVPPAGPDRLSHLFSENEIRRLVRQRENHNRVQALLAAVDIEVKEEERRHADVMYALRNRLHVIRHRCDHVSVDDHEDDPSDNDPEPGFGGRAQIHFKRCSVCGERL